MKYYRLNQIAMAVLGALLLIFGTRTIIQIAFQEHKPEQAHKEEKKPGEPAGGEADLAALLAKGDAAKGETTAAVCKACHSFDAGAPSPIGPNLHNVVGRKIASVEGFNYSPALKAKSGEDWTYENLDKMIHNPGQFAPGTLMAFPGIADAAQRADVILFLKSKTENPPPLPEAGAAPAAAPEGAPAPAEGAKPAGDKNAEVAALVGKADPAKGETAAAVCKACHAFDKDAPSPIGPNLYGVLGRKIASVEGFNYSPGLKEKSGESWDYAHVDAMITNPAQYAPGTMMAFPGIPDANQRADVIAFLRTKADTPFPLPEGGAAAPAAEEKPAEVAPPAAEQAPPPAEEEQPAEEAPPAAEEPPAEAAPPAEEAPAEPTPPAAEEPAPAPGAPAEEPAPAPEAPTEAAPPAEETAPPVEEAAPPAEEPAPAPEAPAEAPAAPAEEPAAPAPQAAPEADMTSPSTETQPQPVVPEESEEEPAPAPAEEAVPEEAAPAGEPTPAAPQAAPEADMTSPSTETQPQPVAPEGTTEETAPAPAEEPAPAAEPAPAPSEAAPSAGDSPSTQPQPVYPEGEPPAGASAPAGSGATPAPADLSSQPQPVTPEGAAQ